MRESTKKYSGGIGLLILGAAGMAEHVTSGSGSFPISAVVFGVGFLLICWSYIR